MLYKHTILKLTCFFSISLLSVSLLAASQINLSINHVPQYFSEDTGSPYISNNTTFVPLAFISQSLGYHVYYDALSKQIIINNGEIILTIGNTLANINGETIQLPAAPFIKQNRTYVPLRAVCMLLNLDVTYTNHSINLTNKHKDTELLTKDNIDLSSFDFYNQFFIGDTFMLTKDNIDTFFNMSSTNIIELFNAVDCGTPQGFMYYSEKFKLSFVFTSKNGHQNLDLDVANYFTPLLGNNVSILGITNGMTQNQIISILGNNYTNDSNIVFTYSNVLNKYHIIIHFTGEFADSIRLFPN